MKMKLGSMALLALSGLLLEENSSNAQGKSRRVPPTVQPQPASPHSPAPLALSFPTPPPSAKILEESFKSAESAMGEADRAFDEKRYGDAKRKTRSILLQLESTRDAGLGIGIPILITKPEVIREWPATSEYSDLPGSLQALIKSVVREHLQGFFPNFINLSKRAAAVYLKSDLAQKKEKGLAPENIEEIIEKLLLMSVVPVYFGHDRGQMDRVAFYSEIINPFVSRDFDRELVEVFLKEPEMKLDEPQFATRASERRKAILVKVQQDSMAKVALIKPTSISGMGGEFSADSGEKLAGGYVRVDHPRYRGKDIAISNLRNQIEIYQNRTWRSEVFDKRVWDEPVLEIRSAFLATDPYRNITYADLICIGLGFQAAEIDRTLSTHAAHPSALELTMTRERPSLSLFRIVPTKGDSTEATLVSLEFPRLIWWEGRRDTYSINLLKFVGDIYTQTEANRIVQSKTLSQIVCRESL